MKILLISPPAANLVYGKIDRWISPGSPMLGIAYIAAVLEENNISVKLLDAWGPNLGLEDIMNQVKKYRPDIVGISCMTPTFGISVEITKLIKLLSDNILVIMGGPHVTAIPLETLEKFPWIDIVVIGEGEDTILEIAQGNDLENIKGIAFRKDDKVVINEIRPLIKDIDSIPFPARHFYNLSNYHQPLYEVYGKPCTTIITSRGCPYKCSFCSSHTIFKRKTRFRSIKNVMREIDFLTEKYKIKTIKFSDDTLTLKHDRFEELCYELKKRQINWIANARVDTLSKDILTIMKDSGCKLIQYGVESGNPAILKQYKKNTSIEQIRKVFEWSNELGIDTGATFIFGAPLETRETALETIGLVKEICPTYANFFILSPYPGTEIYDYMNSNGMMKIKDWTEVRSPKYENYIINHPNFSHLELKKIQSMAYRRFYLNLKYIFTLIRKINSWHRLKIYFHFASIVNIFTRK